MRFVLALAVAMISAASAQAQYGGGSGTADDPYQIWTAEQLKALGVSAECDACFVLMADIDLEGDQGTDGALIWTTCGSVFDGNGHVLSNPGCPIFRIIGSLPNGSAAVKNLGIVDPNIVSDGLPVGALACVLTGRVQDCYVEGGRVSGDFQVGGLIGQCMDDSVVWNCQVDTTVSANRFTGGLVGANFGGRIIASRAAGEVIGSDSTGGLVGFNSGLILNSYATNSVSGVDATGGLAGENAYGRAGRFVLIESCYSTGLVVGESGTGGLVGVNHEEVVNSFWDIEASGLASSAAGVGKTTAEMQTAGTFLDAGWDFIDESANGARDAWWIDEGLDYPRLSSALHRYSGGTGEPNDPYQIATVGDLIALGDRPEDYEMCFVLTSDLDLDPNLPGGCVFGGALIAPAVPLIGYAATNTLPFAGVFDGSDHAIRNLCLVGPWQEHLGLLGSIGASGLVCNLRLENVLVQGSQSLGTGGLAGASQGVVANCRIEGGVVGMVDDETDIAWNVGGLIGMQVGGTTCDCYSSCDVSGYYCVGGLVGQLRVGTLCDSGSEGNVRGNYAVGGLVGDSYAGSLGSNYSRASVRGLSAVGGLLGQLSDSTLRDSYSRGDVQGSEMVGGLVGIAFNASEAVIDRCYSAGAVSGGNQVGGLAGASFVMTVTASFWDTEASGLASSAAGVGRATAKMQRAGTFLAAGWDFAGETDNGTEDIWWIDEGLDYPRLWWELAE